MYQFNGVPKVTNLNQQIDMLYELSKYVQQLLQAGDCVQLVNSDHQTEIVEEWNKLSSVISTINQKRNPHEILDSHAFELLFIYFGLQMFLDPKNMQESLLDLYVCHKKSTKRRMSLAKYDGPPWMDVVTELLLSMMFKSNLSSRVVAKQVMSFLADHVTTSTVQLIVDALEQTNLDDEEGMVGMEDDGDEDDDDNDRTQIDDDNVDDDDGSSGDNDDEDDEDDDEDDEDNDSDDSGIEEESDVVVNDKLREKLKIALGDAAGNSDDDDDDENGDDKDVEFSDSEMFKLDSVLASAFRSMTKSKKMDKQRNKQLLNFKARVLDLVEVIFKSQPSPVITKGLILPLLSMVEGGLRKANEEDLGNRAQGTLQILLKQKKVKPDNEVDKDELLEMVEYLMKCSNKVPLPSFIQDTGNACLYVLKLLLQDSGISPLKTRSKAENKQKKSSFYKEKVEGMMKSAILDLLNHKQGHCQPAFFHILIVKFPLMFWSSYKELIDTVKSQDAKAFDRTQAAAFLANMISKELFDEVEPADWTQFVNSWKSVANLVIKEMACENKFKKNLLEEVVATCNQIRLMSPGKLSLDKEVSLKLLEMQIKCEKPIKKAIKKLTKGFERPQQANENEVKKGGKKKNKKDKADEAEDSASPKKTNVQNQSVSQEDEMDCDQPEMKKEHRKRKKSGKFEKQSNDTLNQSVTNNDDIDNEPVKTFLSNETPKSQKKKKRRSKSSFKQEDENMEPVLSPGSAKKAKLN